MRKLLFRIVLVACISALALAACGGDDDSGKNEDSSTTQKITIKLADMSWHSAQATTAVAKVLLEDELGYTVELVSTSVSSTERWEAMAAGTLHAQLEIWPWSAAAEVSKYIEQDKVVEYGGDLDVVAQGGWYVPFYMIAEHPELKTWEGLKDPDIVALFATEETGDQGRMLSGDPEWVQGKYAETMLQNLGLDFQVVHAGSEEAELALLKEAYDKQEPILIYFWTPHWALGLYDLFRIQLPPYSEECYADLTALDCDYAPERLGKALWPGLKDAAPDAYQFLLNFTLTTQDQIEIMSQMVLENKTPEEAARSWITQHEQTWKAWLPES